jgi:drug/metabolite transporter (DMT)-like permease
MGDIRLSTRRNTPVLVSLGIVYVVWGSTYLAIRVMVRTIPPLFGAGARFLIAGTVLGGWIAATRGIAGVDLSLRQLANAAATGLLILVGGIGSVTVAEQDVPSGLTALLIASIPLWVILLRLTTAEDVARRTISSVTVGFVGLCLLLLPNGRSEGAEWAPALLVVGAAVSTAVGAFCSKRWDMPPETIVATAIEMVAAGIVLLIAAWLIGESPELSAGHVSTASLLAFGYLVTFGSIAYSAFVWLLDNAPVSLVATYAYVNPVIALILGVTFLNEALTPVMAVGAVAIVASVVAVVRTEGTA